MLWSLDIEIWDLPFDVAQGGQSFDVAQDREPVERPVEPFVIWCLGFGILIKQSLLASDYMIDV